MLLVFSNERSAARTSLLVLSGPLVALSLVWAGCQPSGGCDSDKDCFAGETCREGTCVPESELDAGSDANAAEVSTPDTSRMDASRMDASGGSDAADTGRPDTGEPSDADAEPGDADATNSVPCSKQMGVCKGATSEDGLPCSDDDFPNTYEKKETRADDLDNDCDGDVDEVYEDVWSYWQTYCARMVDGGIRCWGADGFNETQIPNKPKKFESVRPGKYFVCGVGKPSSKLHCWGRSANGQTNPPSGAHQNLALGTRLACAIDKSTKIDCWGSDSEGGVSDVPNKFARDVAVGWEFGCGIETGSGNPFCWGRSGTWTLPPSSTHFTAIEAGQDHVCGLKNNDRVKCWGDDDSGETSPPKVDFRELAAGYSLTCGVTKQSNKAKCWGDISGSPPTAAYRSIAAGNENACAVRTDNRIECWGTGHAGELDPP